MEHPVSIAIETSCRLGGVALGMGDELLDAISFDATGRHATQLICHLDNLLGRAGLSACDLDEVYVSAGPGSFTGLRVGITAARTLAQAVGSLRCVGVSTAHAIAAATADLQWDNLAVLLDSRQGSVHVTMFSHSENRIVEAATGGTVTIAEFLRDVPRPVMLVGEGLGHVELTEDETGITTAPLDWPNGHLPTVENVWRLGRGLGADGAFVEYHHLLPIYARRPEALRLWEKRMAKS